MVLPKRVYETLWGVLFASLLFQGGSSATTQPSPQTWGETVSGLQLTIYLDRAERVQSKTPNFRVELRNAGENDLILNLGSMLANGKKQYPDAVVLTLTDSQGKSQRLVLQGPFYVVGRVDPLVLPIPVGSTFSIPVHLDKYGPLEYKFKPATYSLEAQLTGKGVSQPEANLDVKGIALMPYWKGTVTSNQLSFEISNQ
jgi:hypothetical protein